MHLAAWALVVACRLAAASTQCSADGFAICHQNNTIFSVSSLDRTCRCVTFAATSDLIVGNRSLVARIQALEAQVAALMVAEPGQFGSTAAQFATSGAVSSGSTSEPVSTSGGTPPAESGVQLMTWGANNNGQLADPSGLNRSVPAVVAVTLRGLTPAVLSSGSDHSFVSTDDGGTILGWGSNQDGQIGDNTTTTPRFVPRPVVGFPEGATVAAIAAGQSHTLAVLAGGVQLYAWGHNNAGQLGDQSTTKRHIPRLVQRPWVNTTVKSIAAGEYFSAALLSNGDVFTWGENGHGQLGTGDTRMRNVPTKVSLPVPVTAIATGLDHTLVLLANGSLASWGRNEQGQLGIGFTGAPREVPGAVSATEAMLRNNVTAIAASGHHSLLLLSNGSVLAWGDNSFGESGHMSNRTVLSPTIVADAAFWTNKTVVALAPGGHHSLVLLADGSLYAWGSNSSGQLGIDGAGPASASGLHYWPQPVVLPAGRRVLAVAAGAQHSVALVD